MRDNPGTRSTSSQFQSPSTTTIPRAPHLLRALSKTQPIQQVTESEARPEETSPALARQMYKHKATAIEHFTRLTHRGRAQVGASPDNDDDSDASSSHTLFVPTDKQKNDERASTADDEPGQSTDSVPSSPFIRRIQELLPTIPSFASITSIGPGSPRSPPSTLQTRSDDPPSYEEASHLPNPENDTLTQGWRPFWSALDRLRLQHGKTTSPSEPSRDDVLDCIDDNNSVMMYGPLEPDDTSEVEIACSEIVSINGDGEEIRTPQPCFTPLPSESLDEALLGRGPRSPPPRFVSLPLDSIDQALAGRSPRTPSPRFAPLPLESIDQVLMGGGREVGSESENMVPDPIGAGHPSEPAANPPPVKEYRVWLPSPTKISVQTMWWGFRIYLPPPVLDILNNKQLEVAKRAALITTALQWLMDHLPVTLLPPQMHPGVAILRHLVPYVGYMGGFIAWSWSAIRSFDKGYGVVLTATWLLPFLLIPGTWEANEVPNLPMSP